MVRLLFFTRCDVFDFEEYFEGCFEHPKNKSAELAWIKRRGFNGIYVCGSPLIDHAQQPMKIHTEITLFYE